MIDHINSSHTESPVKAGSKDKILEAALGEFAERGQAGARVDKIATVAGVNKALIYYHFKSKENLYHEVIAHYFSGQIAALRRRITDSDSVDLQHMLASAVDVHYAMFGCSPHLLKILQREMANPNSTIADTIASVIIESEIPKVSQALMARGIEEGRIRAMNIKQALSAFVAMSIGYYLLAPVFDKVLDIDDRQRFFEERKAVIVDIFLNGVRTR